MDKNLLIRNLRNVPNFPKEGIQFKDVSTLFKDPGCIKEMLGELVEIYKDKGITKVVGIESRGFVMGAMLAEKLGAGFVMCGFVSMSLTASPLTCISPITGW